MSPARTCACPAATTVPTIERTIWWQKAVASISKRSTPSPRSVHPARRTRRTSDDRLLARLRPSGAGRTR